MYFFQDDYGLLIQHTQFGFWQFLIFPQAEHFAPLLHAATWLEFHFFKMNFYGYLTVSTILHFINIFLLYKILRILKLDKIPAIIVTSLFAINLTFVEPLLWFSAQGVILVNIFIALSFYFYLKKSPIIYLTLLAAPFSYSTGLGLGVILGVIALIKGRFNFLFFLIGIISIVIGPLFATSSLGQITPTIENPMRDLFLFIAFVIGGVGRGVFGRLFLPGFEPRHFELAKTVLSFLPFTFISALITKLFLVGPKKLSHILVSLTVLVVYPYVWAGAIRYHFGIKQALAERYAYTPLFFALILIGLIFKYFLDKKIIRSAKIPTLVVSVILIFQIFAFHKKANEFEVRPRETKKYLQDLKTKVENGVQLSNDPLPSFINQPLKVSDLSPILSLIDD